MIDFEHAAEQIRLLHDKWILEKVDKSFTATRLALIHSKAALHWIRKGNEEKAARQAREAFHYANIAWMMRQFVGAVDR